MKRSKKKPNPKRPQLWYQPGRNKNDWIVTGPRLRILYPNGRIEWIPVNEPHHAVLYQKFQTSCINDELPAKSLASAIDKMREWDCERDFPKAKFLENL